MSPNRELVSDDAFRIQQILASPHSSLTLTESVLRSIDGPILELSGLVLDHPAVIEATQRLSQLRKQLKEHRANYEAKATRATNLDLGGMVLPLLVQSIGTDQPLSDRSLIPLPSISLLRSRADTNSKLGLWDQATNDFRAAITEAEATDDHVSVAGLVLRWSRIAWDPEIGHEVDDLLETILPKVEQPSLVAQLKICQLGGTFQSGVAAATTPDQILSLVAIVERDSQTDDLAWTLIRARKALLGLMTPVDSLAMAARVIDLAGSDPLIRSQGLQAQFTDQLRAVQLDPARSTLAKIEALSENTDSAMQAMGHVVSRNCWNLALGRLEVVQAGLAQAIDSRSRLAGPTVDQAIMAQSFWLARERNDRETMRALVAGSHQLASTNQSTPVWSLGAANLEADLGQTEQALSTLMATLTTSTVSGLPPGPHRAGILALISEVLALAAHEGLGVDRDMAEATQIMLEQEATDGILLGWPTVYFGSKHRFIGFAALASGCTDRAKAEFVHAVGADRLLPAHHARSLSALGLTGEYRATQQAALIRQKLRGRLPPVNPPT